MDRERAETHLRLLAEAELRRVMAMSAGSIRDRWYSADLVSPWRVRGANPWMDTRMVTAWLTLIPRSIAASPGSRFR